VFPLRAIVEAVSNAEVHLIVVLQVPAINRESTLEEIVGAKVDIK
jgi:hypothetical protein